MREAASAPLRGGRFDGRLPPNPSNTLCPPEQQREKQRAAELAVIEQDAMALRQLVAGALPPSQAGEPRVQDAGPHSLAAPSQQQAVQGGLLSSLTLHALLEEPHPRHPMHQHGSPPGAGAGLPADPSALAAYMAGLEDSSTMLQRQLMHLQASTSDGPVGNGVSKPFRSARHAPGTREVFVLGKWLEVETRRFNATYSRKDERTPLVDFLLLAAAKAKAIYSQAYAELARQVTQQCEERGRLMADVWIGYASMLDSVLSRVHAAYAVVKDRAERAEVRLEMAELQLEQERAAADAYKVELQDELARLRAELTTALSMGGGGGHVDVMSVVLGPRGEPSGGDDGRHMPMSHLSRDGSLLPQRSVRFRESTVSMLSRSSTLSGKRGTSAAIEELRHGSRKASIAMGNVMRQLQDAAGGTSLGISSEDAEALQQQNAVLREALDAARQELLEVYKQMADLESTADEVVQLESRAEAAENERDEAAARLRVSTPRPQQNWDVLLELVGKQGVVQFQAALDAHRQWPTDDLALLLAGSMLHAPGAAPRSDVGVAVLDGQRDGPAAASGTDDAAAAAPYSGSHLRDHVELGLGCLRGAVAQGLLTRDAIKQAVQSGDVEALLEAAEDEHAEWLEQALGRPAANQEALVDFLVGATRQALPLSPTFYGCMQQHRQGVTFDELRSAVQWARMSTKTRVAVVEEEARELRKECVELREIVHGYKEVEQRRDAARRRREEEAVLERKNPLQQYVELLGSQEEAAWKEWLIGMGQAADVPRLFKHSGKIRNKHLSKRDTEKLVKEIWKERMADPAAAAGKACDLQEFLFQQLQKRVGIVTAVVEAGYNFLYGLFKYQWDADCELFLRILLGEVKEDVYVAQIRLQEELFAAVDKAKGQATGFIPKEDLRTAFLAYFKVGQPGGKTLKRFDELVQAMDEDQEGDTVEWRKVFEEDREFNQGEFAESIRDQFLQERVEFFKALEEAVYDEAGHEEECSKEHVVRALLRVDLDMTEKTAQSTAGAIFGGDIDLLSVKAVMRKLSRGVVRRGRASSTKASVMGAAAGLKAKGKKGGALSDACLRAMEALRQDWIARELARNA